MAPSICTVVSRLAVFFTFYRQQVVESFVSFINYLVNHPFRKSIGNKIDVGHSMYIVRGFNTSHEAKEFNEIVKIQNRASRNRGNYILILKQLKLFKIHINYI